MIEVPIKPEWLSEAQDKAERLGELKNSIEKGGGNLTGYLGEFVAHHIIGGTFEDTRDYDLIRPDGQTVDVKTKRTTVTPLPHYECSIAHYNTKQACDFYAFVRVLKDYSLGWFLGFSSKEDYFKRASYNYKGSIDPSNGFRFKATCYNLPISELEMVEITP